MAGVVEPPEEEAHGRDARSVAMRIVVAVVVVALAGYGAFRVASQKRSPSGAREASPLGPPAVPGLGEISVTCAPTLQGARGNVFSVALDIRSSGEAWSERTLKALEGELASLAEEANPGFHIRVGNTTGGSASAGSGGTTQQGSATFDWKRSLDPSGAPRVDDLVASIREMGAEPQVDVKYFAESAAEAGSLVAFLNGNDVSDPDVALRKSAGRAEPPRVDVFELGSQPPSIGAQVGGRQARSYGREVEEFAREMRRRSPTPIRILAPLTDWRLSNRSPGALGSLVEETKDHVDGYTISFAPASDVRIHEPAQTLSQTLTEARRIITERVSDKNMILAVSPWDMGAFAGPSGPSWRAALVAAAGSLSAARAGATIMNFPGIPPTPQDSAGYTYWPGADAARPSPTYILTRALTEALPRELLTTELTHEAVTETESESTPTPRSKPRSTSTEGLMAQCAREEGARRLVILNVSGDAVLLNVKVGFQVGERMTKTVLVAPLDSPAVERSESEFVSRTWYSDSIPPHSLTIWTYPR